MNTVFASVVPGSGGGLASIPVGTGPIGISYDSTMGELLVENQGSNNVSVISDATNRLVATVPVGSLPMGAAYDGVRQETFVSNWGSNTVSVILDPANSVVATVPVGSNPLGIAYDAARGLLFVANVNSNSLTVISDTTNNVVATVPISSPCNGSNPYGILYAAPLGEVFVSMYGGASVCVLNSTTYVAVASVSVGNLPQGMALDSATGTVWAASGGSNSVSVINASSRTVVASLAAGPFPDAVAYDAYSANVFVTSSGATPHLLTTFDGRGYALVSQVTIGGSAGPLGVAYDTGMNEAFVANFVANNVSAYPGSEVASANFTVTGSVALSPVKGPTDTLVAATGSGFSSSATISFTFAGGSVSSTCATDTTGTFPGTSGTACTFSTPSHGAGTVTVIASDGTRTAKANFTVTSASLSLTPSNGPTNTLVTLSGSGYAPSTAYRYCFRAGFGTPCSSGPSFASTSSGSIPAGTSLSSPSSGTAYVDVSQGTTNYVDSARFSASSAALSLSPSSGWAGTLVTLSGSGYADSTTYDDCFSSSSSATCGSAHSFASSASGAIPSGVALTVPSSANQYIDVSQGSTNFIESAPFNATVSGLSLSPATGPPGSLVTLSGVGYPPNSLLTYCFSSSSTSACSSGSTFTSNSTGGIPRGTTITTPAGPGNTWVDISQGSTFFVSASFTPTTASLSLQPAAATTGTSVTLSGSGLAPSVMYLYCLQAGPFASCPNTTSTHFTANSLGKIPGNTQLTVPSVPAGTYSMDVSQGSASANLIVGASFAVLGRLTLSPTSGKIGNLTTASGAGFAAHSNASLVWDFGRPGSIGLQCSSGSLVTGAAGNFTCKFVVPPAAVGAHVVEATVGTGTANATYDVSTTFEVIHSINPTALNFAWVDQAPVGDEPMGVAYDAGTQDLFVSNYANGTVTVLGKLFPATPVNPSSQLNVTVGLGPIGIAYDPAKGEVFVADSGSGQVSIISDRPPFGVNKVNLPGGKTPYALAYDPAQGDMIVTDPGISAYFLINDTTSLPTPPVLLPAGGQLASPIGVVYDSGKDFAYVTDSANDWVDYINLRTNAVNSSTIPVPGGPAGAAYDSGKGEIFVTQARSGQVTIINDTSNTPVWTVTVGGQPAWATYDNNASTVFVSSPTRACIGGGDGPGHGGYGNVTGINDTNNTVYTKEPLNGTPAGLAYDSYTGWTWVADSCRDEVRALTSSWNTPFTVAYDSARGEIYAGNTLAPTVSVFSDRNDALLGTIPVLGTTFGLAYDSAKGEIFVADNGGGSGDVSVIDDATNQVVTNIHVGLTPGGMVYVPSKGEVFVVDYFLNGSQQTPQIGVINDTCDCVRANISGVGIHPYNLAYDSGAGEVFATDFNGSSVVVASVASNTVVARVAVGANTFCTGIVYDPTAAKVFAQCDGPDPSVFAIDDRNNTVVGRVAYSSWDDGIGYGIVYDSVRNVLLVTVVAGLGGVLGDGGLSAIAPGSLTVVANIPIYWWGPGPAVYDSGQGVVFVSDYISSTISILSA